MMDARTLARNEAELGFSEEIVTEFAWDEKFDTGGVPLVENWFEVRINPLLKYRRIYCHFAFTLSVGTVEYVLAGEVKLFKGGRLLSNLPICRINDSAPRTLLTKSKPNLFANNQDGVNDTIEFALNKEFGSDTVIMSPLLIASTAERATFSMSHKQASGGTIDSFRAILAVFSSNVPVVR